MPKGSEPRVADMTPSQLRQQITWGVFSGLLIFGIVAAAVMLALEFVR